MGEKSKPTETPSANFDAWLASSGEILEAAGVNSEISRLGTTTEPERHAFADQWIPRGIGKTPQSLGKLSLFS